MIKMSDTRGFSLIEAVVAIAVLGVGIVSVFTIYHTVIIGQRVSEGILEQSLNINGIVNEIRTGIPAGKTEQAFEQEIAGGRQKEKGFLCESGLPVAGRVIRWSKC